MKTVQSLVFDILFQLTRLAAVNAELLKRGIK